MSVLFDPDAELMLRIKRGDDKAFNELIVRHQQSVFNLVYRYMGNASDAEELAQEAFLKVYQARFQYKPVAKFKTWMYRIVVNMCLNVLRQKRPAIGLPEDDLLRGREGGSPTRQIHKKELEAAVKMALQTLPGNQKMAVILTQFEELSYDQAAETLGVSVSALKSLIVRAKENLAEKLNKWIE